MRHNSGAMFTVRAIRSMIEDGASDAEIAAAMSEPSFEHEIETKVSDYEDQLRYGLDDDDGMTGAQRAFHDRLSLGRNDAGEWLGFM